MLPCQKPARSVQRFQENCDLREKHGATASTMLAQCPVDKKLNMRSNKIPAAGAAAALTAGAAAPPVAGILASFLLPVKQQHSYYWNV